ncbi:hypothetical protein Gotri_006385 [Gossypium trilobum]|uniref:Uncharacterized protein n=1 Tax=Gossypium trilobum TaxID=34281 RepID=A0A7J9F043_9ROSI|nr:hypothetical protein [Gossypium trilobum]
MWKEALGILILLMAYWLQLMRVVYSVPISLQQGLDQLVWHFSNNVLCSIKLGYTLALDSTILNYSLADNFLQTWKKAKRVYNTVQIQESSPYSTISYWRKSKLGWYKCNVDVACFEVEKASTYATVIRDWSGKVVNSVSSHRGILLTPSLVEIYVFKEVLSWMHGLS